MQWVFVTCAAIVGVVGAFSMYINVLLGALLLAGAGAAMGLTVLLRGQFGPSRG